MRRGGGGGGGGGGVLLLLTAALLGVPLGARAGSPPARPCPPCPPHNNNCQQNNFEAILNDECHYKVSNASLFITSASKYFSLECPDGVSLNSTSLPRFPSAVHFSKVKLSRCPLPNEPYAVALQRLNVGVIDHLVLFNVSGRDLRDDHFHNLTELTELDIRATNSNKLKISKINETLFTKLPKLKYVSLESVTFPPGMEALKNLTSLESLKLNNCMQRKLWREVICKLPALKNIYINDDSLTSVSDPEVPCNITTVSLLANRLNDLPSFDAVQSLTLKTRSIQINRCSNLENLTVINRYIKTLPVNWLVECDQLKILTLILPQLSGPLPTDMLAGKFALLEFTLKTTSTGIQLTDNTYFKDTRKLKNLKLSNNKLKELPSGVFSSLKKLETLDLSDNALNASAILEVQGQTTLRTLWLQNNPLGDLCHSDLLRSLSMLDPLRSLEELSLANTGATSICTDWRLYMRRLNTLFLEDNNITMLQWQDLQDWNRDVEVNLKRNGKTNGITIFMDKKNYANLGSSRRQAKFIMGEDSPLLCDCNAYWFVKAERENLLPVKFEDVHCLAPSSDTNSKTNPNLSSFSLDLMVCFISDGCPEGCSCILQPQNARVLIECTNSTLGKLPNITALEKELENSNTMMIRVNYRNISVLSERLSSKVTELDIRNNTLRGDDAATARALVAGGLLVWLAGNPLDCGCGQPLLRELWNHISQIKDVDEARCTDGRVLRDALSLYSLECGAGGAVVGERAAVWGAGGAALALLLSAAAAVTLRRPVRLRIKAFLLARGLCLRWVLPDDDDDCKYDAFLSYAHEDAELAGALLAELESGGGGGVRPLRLCVHHRDWRPGEWIPKQIAQSVKESRRTIILLSEHFAKSSWARAEFREAYAHALRDNAVRLVVVVVGDAPPADLDPDIQHYVTNNTYLRWGEPAFWEKLRLALPTGRLRPPPLQTSQSTSAKSEAHPPTAQRGRPARAPRHPPPLRTDPPAHPPPPQPQTPVVKFAHIDFPAPIKPAKNSAPPCA